MGKDKNNKIKTEWDLSIFYKSPEDPQMEKDLKEAELAYSNFRKKYLNNVLYLKNDKALLEALESYEKLLELKFGDTYTYLSKLKDLDSRRKDIDPKINLVIQRIQNISNSIIFFTVNLSKVPQNIQKNFLKSSKLTKYKYFLKKLFENSKYILSEKEERILSLTYLTSYKLWVDFLNDLHSKQTISHKNKEIPISEASEILKSLKTQKDRYILYTKINKKAEEISHIAERELNAIVLAKKNEDELRGYEDVFDATIISYENEKDTVINLVKIVTEAFPLVHKFYRIKAKMLGLKKLKYSDRFALVGKSNKTINFEEGLNILKEVFSNLDPFFNQTLENYVRNGQIDVFPKIGKRGGAYCSGGINRPTFVFLNYVNTIDSVYTFAHEMGHAIHTELSKNQSPIYQDYSISTAEVASTLFENFVFENQFKKLKDKEKIIALHDKISDCIGTIFTQITLFNFETEMHKMIREKGFATKEELSKLMLKHLKACYGPSFEYEDKNGLAFVTWPHIRYFFYVYTYAFGLLISNALYKKHKEDSKYIEQIKIFMSKGSSMSPEEIFNSIGVNLKDPEFFKKGIEVIKEEIELLEKLVNKK